MTDSNLMRRTSDVAMLGKSSGSSSNIGAGAAAAAAAWRQQGEQ